MHSTNCVLKSEQTGELKCSCASVNLTLSFTPSLVALRNPIDLESCPMRKKKQIPSFDHSLTWRKKTDRAPRKKLSPITGPVTVPSMKDVQTVSCTPSIREQITHRQRNYISPHSGSPNLTPSKRQKLDQLPAGTSSDECMSSLKDQATL